MKKILIYLWSLLLIIQASCLQEENAYDINKPVIEIDAAVLTTIHQPGGTIQLKARITDDTKIKKVLILNQEWGISEEIVVGKREFDLDLELEIPEHADLSKRNIIIIEAYDKVMNKRSVSVVVNFGNDDEAPAAVIHQPTEGQEVLLGDKLALDIDVTDNFALDHIRITVEGLGIDKLFLAGGAADFKILAQGDMAFTVPITAATGSYELSLYVKDLAGNEFSTSVSFEVTSYEKMFIVGGFNGWNIDEAPEMTKDPENMFKFSIRIDLPGNTEFKFVSERNWGTGIAFGLENGELSSKPGGGNIPGPAAAGLYDITFDVKELEYTIVAVPMFDAIYMLGNATSGGWDNNQTAPTRMYRNPNNSSEFVYTGKFNAGMLKFIANRGNWAPQWGKGENGKAVFRATESDPDPAPFDIAAEGYYTVIFNISTLDISIEAYNASGATVYDNLGVIGSATSNGWGAQTNMSNSVFDPHQWVITTTLSDGEMKFRAIDDWDHNWGGGAPIYGVGTHNGSNIHVTAGSYFIKFNDLTGHYIIEKQ